MKPETLEALLLDRALGELPPETGELLDAYLAQNPAAADRAESYRATTALARQALAAGAPCRAATSAPSARVSPCPWRGVPSWTELSRLAACVALGGVIGWLVPRGGPAEAGSVPSVTAAPVAMVSGALDAASSSKPFWSVGALAGRIDQRATDELADRPYRLRWDSPARMPRWEEKP